LPKGIKVVVLNFTAANQDVSNYVIEELTAYIVNDGSLAVVDRRNLALLQEEMDFQLSGEVSDATAQEIGKKLGAQTIISGSLTALGDVWRMRVQAIQVETAQIQVMQTLTITLDPILAALLHIPYTGTGGTSVTGRTSGSGRAETPSAAGDFSGGARLGAAVLNLALGLGSYAMGDVEGGVFITLGYAVAGGLIAWEMGLDWGSPLVGGPGTVAVAVAGVTVLYGIIRPFVYDKPSAVASALSGFTLAVLPAERGVGTVSLSYTVRF
jgi:TolB-like protein